MLAAAHLRTELKCGYCSAQSLSTGRICRDLGTRQKFRRS
jgi:hypothetical protein